MSHSEGGLRCNSSLAEGDNEDKTGSYFRNEHFFILELGSYIF